MGNIGVSNRHSYNLNYRLMELKNKWKARNDEKRSNYTYDESVKGGAFAVIGGIVGGLLGGPPGAVLGAALGGGGSAVKSKMSSGGFDRSADCY